MKIKNVRKLERAYWHLMATAEAIMRDEPQSLARNIKESATKEWCDWHDQLRLKDNAAAEKRDAGVALFEVFQPVHRGQAVKHSIRTPHRMITQTYWKNYATGAFEKPLSEPHVDTLLRYTSPEQDFKRLQKVEVAA